MGSLAGRTPTSVLGSRAGLAIAAVVLATTLGCSGGTEPGPQGATAPPSSTVTSAGTSSGDGYDVTGRDVPAICRQLEVFADRWDAEPAKGATEQAKAELGRQISGELTAATDTLRTLAPPALADDVAGQLQAFLSMTATYLPSASVTAPPTSGPPVGLEQVGAAQQRINAFSQSSCGFRVWT
jgi:hypothetical protein